MNNDIVDFYNHCIEPMKKVENIAFHSSEWCAKHYATASELENYINSIKDKLIGKPLHKIMVMGRIFNDDRPYFTFKDGKWYENVWNSETGLREVDYGPKFDPNRTENVILGLDEPVVLFIGDDRFEIEYCEGSYAQVALNTLTFKEISAIEGCLAWKDVSSFYSKNIIGQTLKNIIISKTDTVDFPVFDGPERHNGDDMYDEIIFEFKNGSKFVINMDIADYMAIYEKQKEE